MTVGELRTALTGVDETLPVCINHEKYGYCMVMWCQVTIDPQDTQHHSVFGLEQSNGIPVTGTFLGGARASTGSY